MNQPAPPREAPQAGTAATDPVAASAAPDAAAARMPPVWVVNLERSHERLAAMREAWGGVGIGFERLPAVDARALPPTELAAAWDAEANRRHYFAPLKPGEIGCYLSHRASWQALAASDGGPMVHVVLEDDVMPLAGADTAALLAQMAAFIAHDRPVMVKLFARRDVQGETVWQQGAWRLVRPALPPLGTQAQMFNRAAARQLVHALARIHEPVDVSLQRWWATGVDMLVLVPSLVREESARLGGSTIAAQRPPLLPWLRREIRRPLFRWALARRARTEARRRRV